MELLNVYNIAEPGESACYCRDTIQDVFDLVKDLLGLENEMAMWKMFNETKCQLLWYNRIICDADYYLRPCLWKYSGLLNTAVEYRRRGIPLSTLLINLLSILYYKFLSHPCCCRFRLYIKVGIIFSSEDFEIMGALSALRGKTEYMQVLVYYGYLWSLPDASPLLKQETDEIMLSFIEAVSNSADIHFPHLFEEVLNMLRNTFFRGKETEAIYKRVFLVACALRAVQYSLWNKHVYSEKLIKCLRLYFSVTSDLYLSSFEVRCVLYSCFILLNKLDLFEQYAQEFDKLMPECPARPKPHTLTHLVRCQVRKNMKIYKMTLPSAVDKLVLPEFLKSFILGEDLPGKSRNTSLQKAVTKSELAGLLFERTYVLKLLYFNTLNTI